MSGSAPANLEDLQRRIGYSFDNTALLRAAITHVSYANEQRGEASPDNERLEFLGDAVITMVISELLFLNDPSPEGVLTRAKNNLVNAEHLAELGRALDLGACLLLGRGEENSGGRDRQSNLCNTFEALVGALYLDGGYNAARRFLKVQFAEPLQSIAQAGTSNIEFKGTLQEQVQAAGSRAPRYTIIAESGPDHDKTFTAQVSVEGQVLATGSGSSKQTAEQEAARRALEELEPKA